MNVNKVHPLNEAIDHITSGQTILCGDFLGVGNPELLVTGILERDIKDLTLIACTTAMPDRGCGRLVVAKRIKKAIVSHIGTNPETGRQLNAGEIEVEFVPQGTLIERIRCGGSGLGGFLTPTGLGTSVEEGKQKMTIDGKDYLLELPLHGDVAIVKAWKGDGHGNLVFRRTAKNFNPICAMAADYVIAEVEHLVPFGTLDPDEIDTPGALVDCVVVNENEKGSAPL